MACRCNEFPPGQVCAECLTNYQAGQVQDLLDQTGTMVLPMFALNAGQMSLERYINDFVLSVAGFSTEIGQVMVIFSNKVTDNTTGVGNIKGVKDMTACVQMLERYVKTLKAGIPPLN